jgi:hypothetical protein
MEEDGFGLEFSEEARKNIALDQGLEPWVSSVADEEPLTPLWNTSEPNWKRLDPFAGIRVGEPYPPDSVNWDDVDFAAAFEDGGSAKPSRKRAPEGGRPASAS